MKEALVSLRGVSKTYRLGEIDVPAVRGVSLDIWRGEFVALMGPSGSGKTTLLHLVGLLDRPSSGQLVWNGREVAALSEGRLAELRGRHIGFVFQTFNLLPGLSARDNVEFPLIFQGMPARRRRKRAEEMLERLGLADRASHRPGQLSGGQQQRVALARALAVEPQMILADEPTGNLDSQSGQEVMGMLHMLASEGRSVLLVTHDPEAAEYAPQVLRMRDGTLEHGA